MKQLILFLLISAGFGIYLYVDGKKDEKIKVYISQLVRHPALDQTTQGILDGLKKAGYETGKNIDIRVEYAQGSATLANQIAAEFISQKPDVLVGVATISAQSLARFAQSGQTKVIFTSVTDPLMAGLVKDLKQPGEHLSGVSNWIDLKPQLELFLKIQPTLKKVGFLYNPGELNSVSILNKLKDLAPRMGLEIIPQVATKTADVAQSAVLLAKEADAIFISNDSTALSALQSIVLACENQRKPVYVSDTDAVALGALAALGPNQYDIGLQTAQMVVQALKGENLKNIPVEFPAKTQLYLNLKAAKSLGMKIPESLIEMAASVVR